MEIADRRETHVRFDRGDWLAVLLGVPLLVAWWSFADLGGYPANDDPFYGRPAKILAEESRFQIVRQMGELSASSAAHVVIGGSLAWLFGFSYRILFLAVMLQMWLASLAAYFCSRQAACTRAISLFMGAVFLFNPLCFGHCFTFMTDGPAMCWGWFAVAAYTQGIKRRSSTWLLLGSCAVAIALWIRQTHVLLSLFPVVAFGWQWIGRQLSLRQFVARCLLSTVPAALALLLFESGLVVFGDEGRIHTVAPKALDMRQIIINFYGLMALLGFLLLPMMPMFVGRLLHPLFDRSSQSNRAIGFEHIVALVWSLLLLAPLLVSSGRACLTSATGTFIQNAHFGPIFLSDFEAAERWGDMGGVIWPNWVWVVLTIASIFNISAIAGGVAPTLVRSLFHPRSATSQTAIELSLCATALPIIALVLSVRTGVLDRYWMLLLPLVFAFISQNTSRTPQQPDRKSNSSSSSRRSHHPLTRVAAVAILVGHLSVSIVFARDFLVWNQTRWRQVDTWLAAGLQARDIDGGRDINAWLRSAEDYETRQRAGDRSAWWNGFAQVSMAIGPRDGWEETGRLKWRAWATGKEHEILLLRRK